MSCDLSFRLVPFNGFSIWLKNAVTDSIQLLGFLCSESYVLGRAIKNMLNYTYFQNYATCVVGTWKVFLVFWLPSIKLRTICFYSKKLKIILKFQPFEYYRKKDKFASFQNFQSKDFTRASRFHIWLTAAKTQKTRRVVSSVGRVILKIGVMLN